MTPGITKLQALVRGGQTRSRLATTEAVGGAAAADPAAEYRDMNVKQLKALLKTRNLTVGGNKDELIARLVDSD